MAPVELSKNNRIKVNHSSLNNSPNSLFLSLLRCLFLGLLDNLLKIVFGRVPNLVQFSKLMILHFTFLFFGSGLAQVYKKQKRCTKIISSCREDPTQLENGGVKILNGKGVEFAFSKNGIKLECGKEVAQLCENFAHFKMEEIKVRYSNSLVVTFIFRRTRNQQKLTLTVNCGRCQGAGN